MQQIELTTSDVALSALVDRVLGGDEVLLMRAGRPVARIVPAPERQDQQSELTSAQQERAREGIEIIRSLANELRLGPFDLQEFKQDRDAGRL